MNQILYKKCRDCDYKAIHKCSGNEEDWRISCDADLCDFHSNTSREGKRYCDECWNAL